MIVKLTSEAQRTLVGCDLIDGLFAEDGMWEVAEKIRDHYSATSGKELLVTDRDFLMREMAEFAEAYDPDRGRRFGGEPAGSRALYRAAVTLLDKVRALKPEPTP